MATAVKDLTMTKPTDARTRAANLRRRVLEGPGETDCGLRQAVAARAAGGPAIDAPYDELVRQIGEAATRITDAQVADVVRAAGSEKAAFEVIAAAALGAGLRCFDLAMRARDEATHASA